jgi:hypothetical protein
VGNFRSRKAIPTYTLLFNTGRLRLETQKDDETTIYCAALLLTHKDTFSILPSQEKQGLITSSLITQEWRAAIDELRTPALIVQGAREEIDSYH